MQQASAIIRQGTMLPVRVLCITETRERIPSALGSEGRWGVGGGGGWGVGGMGGGGVGGGGAGGGWGGGGGSRRGRWGRGGVNDTYVYYSMNHDRVRAPQHK